MAAGPRWRQTTRGLYVPADVSDQVPEQRILEQSMRLPRQGAVTGWAACLLHGAAYFDGLGPDGRSRRPVPLWVGRHRQVRADDKALVIRDLGPPADQVVLRSGVPCVRRVRAVLDAARLASGLREAVVALDMAAAAELASLQQVRDLAARLERLRGLPQVRAACALASEESWSPNESRLRLMWTLDAGLPAPLANAPVFDMAGRLLGVADLLDPQRGVVGEYDGANHRSARRHSADVDREARLRDVGLEVCRFTGPDLQDPARVVARLRGAFTRAGRHGRGAWTLTLPAGWEPDLPLHDRLTLRAEMEAQMEHTP